MPITIGDTIEPKKIPNLCQSLFNGFKNVEFKTPKTKKIKDKIRAHNLKSSWDFKGHSDIAMKTTKNKNPKLLFDEILTKFFFMIPKSYTKIIAESVHEFLH